MTVLRVFCYMLAALAVFVFAATFTMKFLITDESTVTCPDLTGLDVQEAKHLAAEKGLSVVTGKYEKKGDVPYNRVLFQTPDAGMPVRAGRIVTVVASDGPVPVIIPSFVGLSFEEAQAALRDAGMKLKKVIYVPTGIANKVVAQIPAGGENIVDPEGMELLVAAPPTRLYVMPDETAGDYSDMLEEMEQKHIRYNVTSNGLSNEPVNGTLKCNIPPLAIFSEDEVLQVQAASGG